MNIRRFTLLFATLWTSLAASPARADEATATLVAPAAPPAVRPIHEVGIGLRVGVQWFSLKADRLTARGLPVDDWTDVAREIVPSFSVGGDGYFFRLDLPIRLTSSVKTYGLGLYPLNFGYLFQRSGIFPYASAGVAASVLTLQRQGVSGATGEARLAAGVKTSFWRSWAVSAEIAYAPFVAGIAVDKQKSEDLIHGEFDGHGVKSQPGTHPARGGFGQGFEFLLGVEWI
jgi:hypothetical protein